MLIDRKKLQRFAHYGRVFLVDQISLGLLQAEWRGPWTAPLHRVGIYNLDELRKHSNCAIEAHAGVQPQSVRARWDYLRALSDADAIALANRCWEARAAKDRAAKTKANERAKRNYRAKRALVSGPMTGFGG